MYGAGKIGSLLLFSRILSTCNRVGNLIGNMNRFCWDFLNHSHSNDIGIDKTGNSWVPLYTIFDLRRNMYSLLYWCLQWWWYGCWTCGSHRWNARPFLCRPQWPWPYVRNIRTRWEFWWNSDWNKFVFSSHKAHKVGANLRFLWRLADRWLSPPPGQDVSLLLETSPVKLVSTYTSVEWGNGGELSFLRIKLAAHTPGSEP